MTSNASPFLPQLLAALLALPVLVAAQDPARNALDSFKALRHQALHDTGIVGSGMALVAGDRVVLEDPWGIANLEEHRPVDRDTIFHWASVTKTFTGIAIMQLRDRGRLRLDDPIVKYVPELREVHDQYGDISRITLRHLMTHSAGFRGPTWPWASGEPWEPFEPRTWAQLVAMMPYTQVLFEPGSRFSYSNLGVVFLGRVIEVLSGDDYEVYIDKNIFRPLEMFSSYFDTTPPFLLPHRSHSYALAGGKLTPGHFDADTGVTVSNGGLNSPIPDMVKYLQFLIGRPEDAARQQRADQVLRRSSLEEMWQPVVRVGADEEMGGSGETSMGLCFFVEDYHDHRYIGHRGGQNNFVSHIYLDPRRRIGFVVAFNTWVASPDGKERVATDALDRRLSEYVFDHVFPAFTP